jgi:hypothetical protein
VACLARVGRIWKGKIVQNGHSAAIKERRVQFLEFLLPPRKTRPEVGVIFPIPCRGYGILENISETDLVYLVVAAAEDPFEGEEGISRSRPRE